MATLHTPEGARLILQIFSSVLLAILFLQSGIDKVIDRHGNLEWLAGHFAKSFLAGMVPLLVSVTARVLSLTRIQASVRRWSTGSSREVSSPTFGR